MIYFLVGLVTLAIPYMAVFSYGSVIDGFLTVFSYSAAFYVTVSIVTQFLHIFSYPVVLGLHVAYALVWIFVIYRRRGSLSFRPLKNNWIFFVACAILFLQLCMVHQFYTGAVDTFLGEGQVYHSSYGYPFFSDEWVAAALSQYSISHNALPFANPLDRSTAPFQNILFVFPSLLAQICLLFGLNPVSQYYLLAVFFGSCIGASIYVLLRAYDVTPYIAAASMLFVLSIINSGNIPGLWILIPFSIGNIFLLWQIISERQDAYGSAAAFSALSLVVYPPLVVLSIPTLLFGYVRSQKNISFKAVLYCIVSGIVITSMLFGMYFLIFGNFHVTFLELFNTYIARQNFNPGIGSYAIWDSVPLFVLFLACVGVYSSMKNRYYDLVAVSGIGLVFWYVYTYVERVFFIEYARIIIITSFFLIVLAGVGFQTIVVWCARMCEPKIYVKKMLAVFGITVILAYALYAPFYTARANSWQKFSFSHTDGAGNYSEYEGVPAVTRYLTPDDIHLFLLIRDQTFIAPPWKGLVIGVATHNFPLETKSSTITNGILLYSAFMSKTCEEKLSAAKKYSVGYVYSEPFSCTEFKEIGHSKENLYLYKVQ